MSTVGIGELAENEELLFRQVHPSFVRDGRVGSQAFRPTPKDKKMLSVAQVSKTTAQASRCALSAACQREGKAASAGG